MVIRIQVKNKNKDALEYIADRIKGSKFSLEQDINQLSKDFLSIKVKVQPHQMLEFNNVIEFWLTMDTFASKESEWVYRPVIEGEILQGMIMKLSTLLNIDGVKDVFENNTWITIYILGPNTEYLEVPTSDGNIPPVEKEIPQEVLDMDIDNINIETQEFEDGNSSAAIEGVALDINQFRAVKKLYPDFFNDDNEEF